MKLVLDNNVLFSIMNPKSAASYLFSTIRAEFFASEFIKSEFNEHKNECLLKSGLSEHEFEIRESEVKENIEFIESSKYKDFLEESTDTLTDPDDTDSLALALLLKSSIWSNDGHLKRQPLVKVYATKELIDKLLKEEI